MNMFKTNLFENWRRFVTLFLLLSAGLNSNAVGLDSTLLAKIKLDGQSPLEITYIVSDSRIPGYLDVNIRAIFRDTIVDYKYLEDSLRIKELVDGQLEDLEVQKVAPAEFDMVTIIMDVSSSMWRPNKAGTYYADSAKIIADSILSLLGNPYMLNLYTFDEDLYRIAPDSIKYIKRPVKARYTHLYECVDDAIGGMQNAKGTKLLIIIGDGENDQNKKKEPTIGKEDLMEKIKGLDESWVICPIAIGPKIYTQNLTQIIQSTKTLRDSISYGFPTDGLWDEVKSLKEWEFTHTILMKSEHFPHIGEERKVFVELGADGYTVSDSTVYRLGQLYDPWNEQANWQLGYFIGGLLAFLIFIAFAFIVPWRSWVDFRKKYVKNYWEVKEEGVQRYDPLTKFPFRDEDQVVVRCEHMQSLETWQYEGRRGGKESNNRKRKGQCLYYPHKCDTGHGPSGISDFFSQVGIYKILMWVFFGVLGGYLGWSIWAIIKDLELGSVQGFLDNIASRPEVGQYVDTPADSTPEHAARIVTETALGPWLYQLLLGFLAAFLITVAVAIGMEASQAKGGWKGWAIARLVLRLLGKGIVAGLLTALVFAGFGFAQYFLMPSAPYLPGLLALLLMGMVIGRTLTTGTGIRNVRGILAGLAGGFVAFHIYYIPILLFNWKSFEGPKMLAFMAMGGILAYILSRSAPALEASEMDIYTGRKRYGTAYVTDLLRKNEEVIIGRGPTATIRMKMRYILEHYAPGNVSLPFARLELRNEVVYLVPVIFSAVNGQPVAPNEKVPLIDGDIITFDQKSPSHLRYREFRTGPHPRRRRRRYIKRKKEGSEEAVNA